MNKLALAAAALACAATLIASPAQSQPMMGPGGGPGYGWGPGMMMGPGMMGYGGRGGGMGMLCNPGGAGLAEWRMERIEQLVQPTESQRAALNDLKAASAKAAEQISAACPREFPASASARMDLMEKRMETMLAAIKTVRPAFDAFYATLSDEQKAKLDRGGPRRWGWRHWGPRNQQ
jgi:hypothetical protein